MVHPLCVASAASSYQPKTIAAASRGGGVSEQRATEHLLRHGSGGFNGVASERKMATGLEASRCGVSNGLRVLLAGWCRSALSGAFGCSCFESTAWCQPLCVASAASSYPHTTTAVEELGSGVVARQAANGFVIHLGFLGGLGFLGVLRLGSIAAVLPGAFGRSSFQSAAWYKPLCAASVASSYQNNTMAAEDLDGGVVVRQAARGFSVVLGASSGLGFVWILRLAGVAAALSGAFGRSSFPSAEWYKPLCAASAASSYQNNTMAGGELDGGVVARQAALALAG